jgi:HAD superfamily phosphoserine phosphatase-like hydrolase
MGPQQNKFSLSPKLFYGDEMKLMAKLERFTTATGKIHAVFDFDRTLTVQHLGTDADITSWNILQNHLPQEGQVKCENLFTLYRAKELAGNMTAEDAVTWWSTVLNIYAEYALNIQTVEQDFLTHATVRDGARELFNLCNELSIPTVILSAGVKDIIDLWARKYDISPSLVLSTELRLNSSGTIIGWDETTLIHTLNKDETDHEELSAIRHLKPFSIVVGDSIHDADMAAGDENVLRIRIIDPRPDENIDVIQERTRSLDRFDLVLESRDLMPITQLIRDVNT